MITKITYPTQKVHKTNLDVFYHVIKIKFKKKKKKPVIK